MVLRLHEIRNRLEDLRLLANESVLALYSQLENGEITVDEWEEQMGMLLTDYTFASYMLGYDTDAMPDEALPKVNQHLNKQLNFLGQFAGAIAIGLAGSAMSPMLGDKPTDYLKWKAWRGRALSYIGGLTAPFWQGIADSYSPGGKPPKPILPWEDPDIQQSLPLPSIPGDGSTLCGQWCKCEWDIHTLDEDAGNYDCYWIMDKEAEHCQTCTERAARWSPLEIRNWDIVAKDTVIVTKEEEESLIKAIVMKKLKEKIAEKGGKGSGNWGHQGLAGVHGGSSPTKVQSVLGAKVKPLDKKYLRPLPRQVKIAQYFRDKPNGALLFKVPTHQYNPVKYVLVTKNPSAGAQNLNEGDEPIDDKVEWKYRASYFWESGDAWGHFAPVLSPSGEYEDYTLDDFERDFWENFIDDNLFMIPENSFRIMGELTSEAKKEVLEAVKGGQGSGNWGHQGLAGVHGGSSPTKSTKVTDTPEFKKWFGDSKVVDENGEPLVVYHGTNQDFQTFDPDYAHFSEEVFPLIFGGTRAQSALFFAASPRIASFYAQTRKPENANVMPVYLKMEKPLDVNVWEQDVGAVSALINEWYDTAAHDGLILRYESGGIDHTTYVVWYPEQVKSVFNEGTFEPENPNIMKEVSEKGGKGSGNWGHQGLAGVHGGSSPTKSLGRIHVDFGQMSCDFKEYDQEKPNRGINHAIYLEEYAITGKPIGFPEMASPVKRSICEEISKRSGVDKGEVNRYLASWASTSNKSLMASEIQKSIAEQFGVPLSDWQEKLMMKYDILYDAYENLVPDVCDAFDEGVWAGDSKPAVDSVEGLVDEFNKKIAETGYKVYFHYKMATVNASNLGDFSLMIAPIKLVRSESIEDEPIMVMDTYLFFDQSDTGVSSGFINDLREKALTALEERKNRLRTFPKINKAIYEYTQEKLKKMYPDRKGIYLFRGSSAKNFIRNPYKGNTVESWTSQTTISQYFGTVAMAKVPIQNIFATCLTGMGCLDEYEFVIFGTAPGTHIIGDYFKHIIPEE